LIVQKTHFSLSDTGFIKKNNNLICVLKLNESTGVGFGIICGLVIDDRTLI